ncbi:MAG TPA: site-2 protease family protein [Candidatus Angelobacter sp.]|nr:site-2 protease family protein [Candidatus Angelobacter sp.]
MPDTSPPPLEYHIYDPERQEIRVVVIEPPKRRYWLHVLLFLATIFTTLCIGARLQYNFDHNLPAFSSDISHDLDYWPWAWALQDWHRLLLGIPFSACLLGILTAHEFGHYVFCVKRKVFATLPFFIPAPTLIGTMGAFIRIRSPIRSRSDLFDIGIAGPIAGFLVAVPVLFFSLLHAKPLTQLSGQTDITFGMPLIFSLAHRLLAAFGNPLATQFRLHDLYLPPTGVAAWFGMFATALNLLPGGQLDGGHIIYAVNPRSHRTISLISVLALLPLAWYFWIGWLLWAVVLRMTGSRHPQVPLAPGLGRKRLLLAAFGILMLVLTLTPSPLPGSGIPEVLKSYHEQATQAPSK